MIWVRGAIVPDDALSISVLDRTFEHGLGLFETFRTWGHRPTLLPRHLERLKRSARQLGLPLDESALPGAADVARLLEAEGAHGDVSIRIMLSGGLADGSPGTLWMRTRPLPPPIPEPGARIRSTWIIPEQDPLARHKSLNYWRRRIVFEEASRAGFHEDLGREATGSVLEGSRTNVFAVSGGILLTPECNRHRPILPGIMRQVILERAGPLGLLVDDGVPGLTTERLDQADEVFLTNSGRGIIPVAQFGPHREGEATPAARYEAPGPWTRRLRDDLDAYLRSGDDP